MEDNAETMLDVVLRNCERHPDKPALNWLDERCEVERRLTYGELGHNTCEIAGRLLAHSSEKKERARAVLCYPPGLEFIEAFLACLRAGVIAVPVSPPYAHQVSYVTETLLHIAKDCGASYVLTSQAYLTKPDVKLVESSEIPWYSTTLGDNKWGLPAPSPSFDAKLKIDKVKQNEVSFLQYTSGSTGHPKGVMVSHGNLLHNLRLMEDTMRAHSSMVEISFLPHYHDMGLIISYLQTLFAGGTSYAMSPFMFVENPGLWIRAFSKFSGTHAKAPNFAFDLVLRKGFPKDVNLASVEYILNASEPVFAETIERFQKVFAPYGLKKNVVSPGYGLAEHTVFVCTTDLGADPAIINNRISCGKPRQDVTMKVVNPNTHEEVSDGKEGEIWINSTSKALGYWQKSEATQNTFIAKLKNDSSGKTYLRTGDLGFISMGQVFCSGRVKDLIVYHGRKIHPSDIEIRIESSFTAVRPGRTVAMEYSYNFTSKKETGVAYVAEISNPTKHTQSELQSLAEEIAARIGRHFLVEVPLVVFINPYTIPRTTSGKRQRALCKKKLDNGTLAEISRWSPHDEMRAGEYVAAQLVSGKSQWKTSKDAPFNRRMSLPPISSLMHPSNKKRRSYDSMRRGSKPSTGSKRNSIDRLTETMSSVIGVRLDHSSNIWAYGCNSVKVAELSKRLKFEFGFPVQPHLFFTHQTPNDLLEKLQLTLLDQSVTVQPEDLDAWPPGGETEEKGDGMSPPDLQAMSREGNHSDQDIAIVGMSCSFAGCNSPEELWQVISTKAIPFTTIHSPPTGRDMHAGFTPAVGMLDYKWFGISEWEASTLDPQQSMLLQVTWECLHSAGYHPGNRSVNDDDTEFGVFIAISGGDAHVMGQSKSPFPPATSVHTSVAANRIARSFNFTGPSMTINTACASSLSALDIAYLYLKAGRCSKALVGGVNTLLDPNLFTILGNMGMTSPNGKCSVFDESANGYVRGEGCGMMLLMPLSTAQEENRRILAVIKSTCSADNGSSSATLTAPNSATQSKLIKQVLANAQIPPENISYIEAHGTGTNLGDPIEVDALKEVFSSKKKDECDHFPPVVGSIKANIGHLETAAGMAGLIKTVQVLEHAQATGNAALSKLNPAFADVTAIHIPMEPLVQLSPSKDASSSNPSSLLTAIVNSFGFGGSVATAVLQQYLPLPHMARVSCGVMLDAQQDGTITPDRVKTIGSVFKANFAAFREADQCWEETIETCILLSDRIKSATRDGTDLDMAVFRLLYGVVSVLCALGMEIKVIAGNDLATLTLTQVITGEMDLTDAIYSLVSQDEMEEETKAEIMESCFKQPLVFSLSLNQTLPRGSKTEEAPNMRVNYSFTAGVVSATNPDVIIEDLRMKLLELRSMSDKLELESCSNKPSKDVRLPAFYQRYPLRTLVDKAIKDGAEETKMANKKEERGGGGMLSLQRLTAQVADLTHMRGKEVGCKFSAYSAEVVDESGYITQAGSTDSLTSSSRQSTPIKAHPTATPSSSPPASTTSLQAMDDIITNEPEQSCEEPKQVVLATLYDQIKEDLDSSDVTIEQFASSGLFELGLDSLNVMQIADFLDQTYKVSKPFSEIIDYDNVGDLAEAIAKESSVLAKDSKPQAPPTSTQAPPTGIQAPPKSKSSSIQVTFPKNLIAVRTLPPNYPTLSKEGYYTIPDMSKIKTMRKEQLQSIQDFTVGRKDAGKLVFLGSTDVTGLNIDELLCIEKECVEIIQQSDPSISDRLNKTALLCFEGIFPSDTTVEGLFSFEQGLKAFCTSSTLPMHYRSYDATTGILEIKVDKFY